MLLSSIILASIAKIVATKVTLGTAVAIGATSAAAGYGVAKHRSKNKKNNKSRNIKMGDLSA